jgi:hypothetical protein
VVDGTGATPIVKALAGYEREMIGHAMAIVTESLRTAEHMFSHPTRRRGHDHRFGLHSREWRDLRPQSAIKTAPAELGRAGSEASSPRSAVLGLEHDPDWAAGTTSCGREYLLMHDLR